MENEQQKSNIDQPFVSSSFHLHSQINNEQMFTTIRQHDISNIRCEKLSDGILFSKMETEEQIKIPYHHCKDFAIAILESFCDFTMVGKINIYVDVNCK